MIVIHIRNTVAEPTEAGNAFKTVAIKMTGMTAKTPTAVILAAGEGRRLKPLTNRRPKPMVPVVNKPVLEHVIEAVTAAGIEKIVLVVGYGRDRIQTYFGDGDEWGVSIEYAVQAKQLGTAHAVQQAASHVDGPFLVLNGDRIIEPSVVSTVRDGLAETASDGRSSGRGTGTSPAAIMAVTRSADPSAYGVVTVEGDRVVDIVEKPRESHSEIINAGVYGFRPTVFDAIERTESAPDGERRLTETITELTKRGEVRAVRYGGRWLDISHLWDLLSVTGEMLDSEGGETAGKIKSGAQVSDAADVDETAVVGANAIVGRGTTIAENVRIGPNATVERSVVFPDATIQAGAVVRDGIVGANATVGANTTVPGGEATVIIDGEVHEDVALGAVIGDNTDVGGATTLLPGTVLGDDVSVGHGATVDGRVSDRTEVRRG